MAIRNRIRKAVLGSEAFRRPSVAYSAEHALLPAVFVRTPPEKLRTLLFLPESRHTTQLNQDIFALLVNRFRPGFFLEIGANDGYTLSNTVYLEEAFAWNGLLVEANPQYKESLGRRKAEVAIAAVVDVEGEYEFCSAGLYGGIVASLDPTHRNRTLASQSIKVWGTTLNRILQEKKAPSVIDFISIDVEGAEVPIVDQLCSLEDYRFTCGCIEHNGRDSDYRQISDRLMESGYHIVWKNQTQHDLFFVDGKR